MEVSDDDVVLLSPFADSVVGDIFLFIQDNIGKFQFGDCLVQLRDDQVQVPSAFLASVSPVFKSFGRNFDSNLDSSSLILPDVTKREWDVFFRCACNFSGSLEKGAILEELEKILNLLTLPAKKDDFTTDKKGKKQKRELEESYVQVEVIETPRQPTHYGLRQQIKRTRYTDEVSDMAEEEEGDEPVFSDYNPNEDDEVFTENEDLTDDEDEDQFETESSSQDYDREDLKRFQILKVKRTSTSETGLVFFCKSDEGELEDKMKQLELEKSDSRSLLRNHFNSNLSGQNLFCSLCKESFASLKSLRIHSAESHRGQSPFFTLPKYHPHAKCDLCQSLMQSYENVTTSKSDFELKDLCFTCPHCFIKFAGNLNGLINHLQIDHANFVGSHIKLNQYVGLESENLTCEFCQKSFSSVDKVNGHLVWCSKNELKNSGLHCQICGKMFSQFQSLSDHLKRHGKKKLSEERRHPCPECPVRCVSDEALENHQANDHKIVEKETFVLHDNCERCDQVYRSYLENDNSSQNIPPHDLIFKCPHCHMIFYAHPRFPPRYVYNHIQKFHMDPQINDFTLPENYCGSGFSILSKQDPDSFKCSFCGNSHTNRNDYNDHLSACSLSTVTAKPGYMCNNCGFIGGTPQQLRNHLELHRRKPVRTKERPNSNSSFRCKKCNRRSFNSKAQLLTHARNCGQHSSSTRIKCMDCDKIFKRKEDMETHALVHRNFISCPIHAVLFKQESEIFQHVNRAQMGAKKPELVCCVCDKTFHQMTFFMKHIRRHLNIKFYTCSRCQKSFNTFSSLQCHKETVHNVFEEGRKREIFKCDRCNKFFRTKGHLKEHIDGVHDQTKVAFCPVCNKTFNTSKRMKKHLYLMHKENADEFRKRNRVEIFTEFVPTLLRSVTK